MRRLLTRRPRDRVHGKRSSVGRTWDPSESSISHPGTHPERPQPSGSWNASARGGACGCRRLLGSLGLETGLGPFDQLGTWARPSPARSLALRRGSLSASWPSARPNEPGSCSSRRGRTVRLTSASCDLLQQAAHRRGIDPDTLVDELVRSDFAAGTRSDLEAVLAGLPEIDGVTLEREHVSSSRAAAPDRRCRRKRTHSARVGVIA